MEYMTPEDLKRKLSSAMCCKLEDKTAFISILDDEKVVVQEFDGEVYVTQEPDMRAALKHRHRWLDALFTNFPKAELLPNGTIPDFKFLKKEESGRWVELKFEN